MNKKFTWMRPQKSDTAPRSRGIKRIGISPQNAPGVVMATVIADQILNDWRLEPLVAAEVLNIA